MKDENGKKVTGTISREELTGILEGKKAEAVSTERIYPVAILVRFELSRDNRVKLPDKYKFVNTGTRYAPAWHVAVPIGCEKEFLTYIDHTRISVDEEWIKNVTGHDRAGFMAILKEATDNISKTQ